MPSDTPPRTPAESDSLPKPGPEGIHDLGHPDYYLNRELTWLNFNFRVLNEAEDPRTPLLERLKFLAIVSSNLDEFFMKRIGGLKQQKGAGVQKLTVDGRTPEEQILDCYAVIQELVHRKRAALLEVLLRLKERGIEIVQFEDLDEADRDYLRDYYYENIYPLVTPQATDPAHPFPFISNLSLNLLVTLRYPGDEKPSMARVKVPLGAGTPRFLKLPDRNVFVPLESVMGGNLDLLFPEMVIESCDLFRLTRNANTEMDEEQAEDLLAMIETELRYRKFSPTVRLQVERGMSGSHRGMLAAELGLIEEADVFEEEGLISMRDLLEIVDQGEGDLRDVAHASVVSPALAEERSIFYTIREARSVLVHHPYESFTKSIERFLKEASQDPKVRAIKMTFYRTDEASKAVDYLIDAARQGKQVAVMMELKARFDEERNIRWAAYLGAAGIHVTYGVVGLKTHCKLIMVLRQDFDGLQRYVHIGTGNYHAVTARQYADLGLFTVDKAIGEDVTEVFNYLTTGYKPKRDYRKLLVAPKAMQKSILDRIDREIESHSEESPGLLQFKANALEDPQMVRALYGASQAGVKIDLIIRDSCRLRPGVEGLSENIRVVSVVGRFLEHARVLYFRNGGDEEYFIGSADLMSRNLRSRVEVLAPVEDEELRTKLRFLLDTQLSDHRSAWEMQRDGSYIQLQPGSKAEGSGSPETLIRWTEKAHKEATRLKKRRTRVASPSELQSGR